MPGKCTFPAFKTKLPTERPNGWCDFHHLTFANYFPSTCVKHTPEWHYRIPQYSQIWNHHAEQQALILVMLRPQWIVHAIISFLAIAFLQTFAHIPIVRQQPLFEFDERKATSRTIEYVTKCKGLISNNQTKMINFFIDNAHYWNMRLYSKLTIIGSDNGLSPGRHQAIIWNNAGILLIRTLGTNVSEILGEIHSFSFSKMHLRTSSAKWRLFGLGLNELRVSFMRSQRRLWRSCIASHSHRISITD